MENVLIFSIIFFLIIVAIAILKISVWFRKLVTTINNSQTNESDFISIKDTIIDLNSIISVQKGGTDYIRIKTINEDEIILYCDNEKEQEEIFYNLESMLE